MPFGGLRELQRHQVQIETLRKMLGTVDALLELAEKLGQDRELTSDEIRELNELVVRRERIKASLSEAGA